MSGSEDQKRKKRKATNLPSGTYKDRSNSESSEDNETGKMASEMEKLIEQMTLQQQQMTLLTTALASSEARRDKEISDAVKAAIEVSKPTKKSVTSQLPNFWNEQPRLWCARVEAIFGLEGVTDDKDKFNNVVAKLDGGIMKKVKNLVENPPAENRYKALKDLLLESVKLTKNERAVRMLDFNPMGVGRPSDWLRDMSSYLETGEDPGPLFRMVFLRLLPKDVQQQLLQTTNTGNDLASVAKLAEEADLFFKVSGARGIDNIERAFEEEEEIATFRKMRKLCSRHQKFGELAWKCEEPRTCAMAKKIVAVGTYKPKSGNEKPSGPSRA